MNESADGSTFRALHRLVEHYTPDGTLGRVLLGGMALGLSPFLLFGGIAGLGGASTFAGFVTALGGSVVGVPAFLLGVIVLWPVYLSLIGNVESPSAYPDDASQPDEATASERAEAVLKRRYADGELSREEFERRLDGVMASGERRDRDEAARNPRTKDDDGEATTVERSRNR